MEDYHCSGCEVFSDLIKVGENDRCLLRGSAADQTTDEDYRWVASPPPEEEAAKVGVGRNQYLLVGAGALKYGFVGCCLHAEVAQVHGIVPGRF